MESATRGSKVIFADDNLLNEIIKGERYKHIEDVKVKETIAALSKSLEKIIEGNWAEISNKKVIYSKQYNLIMPDTRKVTLPRDRMEYKFEGYTGTDLNWAIVDDLFYKKRNTNPLIVQNSWYINNNSYNFNWIAYHNSSNQRALRFSDANQSSYGYSDTGVIKIPRYSLNSDISHLESFLKENLIPEKFSESEKNTFKIFRELYGKGFLIFEDGDAKFTDNFINKIIAGEYDGIDDISFKEDDIKEYITSEKIHVNDDLKEIICGSFLKSDYIRAEIEPYDKKILEDPNRGHWELWKRESDFGTKITTDLTLMGKNPVVDIKRDGIVGIDFGTKSTIVVHQDGDDNTMPMRIGRGKFKKDITKEDYENPTVMEFINMEDFMDAYQAKAGRPYTLWNDLTVSHKAAEQLKNGTDSSKFYSFFSDLKQWCGDKNRLIRIRDSHGIEKVLPPFLEIEEGEMNPVEIYAYYLGLFINNMYNKIYLNYLLSFPCYIRKKCAGKDT